jgi:hypothetical protein
VTGDHKYRRVKMQLGILWQCISACN